MLALEIIVVNGFGLLNFVGIYVTSLNRNAVFSLLRSSFYAMESCFIPLVAPLHTNATV